MTFHCLPKSRIALGKSLLGMVGLTLVTVPANMFADCLTDRGGVTNAKFAAQTSTFTYTYTATPSVAPINAGVGTSDDPTNSVATTATFIRFNPAGTIDAVNGKDYEATNPVKYNANVSYTFTVNVDIPNQVYSVWVQRTGDTVTSTQIAKNFALRTVANTVIALDNEVVDVNQSNASLSVCNFAVNQTSPAIATPNCNIIIPDQPLTAQGLSTPFQLVATDPDDGPCHQSNPNQSAFVQAVILDTDTGALSTYAPLVIDAGTKPAVAPIVPKLPQNNVVAIWFGFNGTNLKQVGFRGFATLAEGRCVNGLGRSLFTQYSYCNAPELFAAVNKAIDDKKLVVPAPGVSPKDAQLCPMVRSFTVVDQDQSDNVPATYLLTKAGTFAQNTAANRAALAGATVIANPSDNRLVDALLDPALGCTAWTIPDLADPGAKMPTPVTNELQAAAFQTAPVALVPLNDPMTLVNNDASLFKTNLYRLGVDQPLAADTADASGTTYCQNFRNIHPTRLALDKPFLAAAASPFPNMANSLFTFMASRAVASYQLLGCQDLLNLPDRITLIMDANGIVTDATIVP